MVLRLATKEDICVRCYIVSDATMYCNCEVNFGGYWQMESLPQFQCASGGMRHGQIRRKVSHACAGVHNMRSTLMHHFTLRGGALGDAS